MVFKRHGETWEQFNEQFKDEEYIGKCQYNRKFFLTILRTTFISSRITALRYQQEQLENAVQEHQWIANEQVGITAAVATSSTAAQVTSRFRDIGDDAEANFSKQLSISVQFSLFYMVA